MPLPEPPARAADAKPVIVLDPGHGGIDPGTSSASGVTEKEVVLAFAKSLKEKLEATGHYDVYLTREVDTFLPLRERVEFAQKKGASLFLSIHADYFPKQTDKATGATVYTLSEQASDDEAKELADQGEFLRRHRRHRAAERFRRGGGEYPDRPCPARDAEPLHGVRPLDRRRAWPAACTRGNCARPAFAC